MNAADIFVVAAILTLLCGVSRAALVYRANKTRTHVIFDPELSTWKCGFRVRRPGLAGMGHPMGRVQIGPEMVCVRYFTSRTTAWCAERHNATVRHRRLQGIPGLRFETPDLTFDIYSTRLDEIVAELERQGWTIHSKTKAAK